MKVDITAVIKEIGQIEEFGQNNFQKRNLVLTETNGQYENLFCVEFSGEKLTLPESFQVGHMVKVSAFVNCREWNGKYFTSLSGSYIAPAQAEQATQQPQNPAFGIQQQVQQTYAQPPVPAQQTVQNAVVPPVPQVATPVLEPLRPNQQVEVTHVTQGFPSPQPASMAPQPLQQPIPQQSFQPNMMQQEDDIPF
jgi:hypothetical protein